MQTAGAVEPRCEKTRAVRIQRDGKILYFGRLPEAEARRVEDAARAEAAATGRVAGTRTVRAAAGYLAHRDDAALWAAEREVRAESGERELMLAVLEDAKRVLARSTSSPIERLEAERWFASNERSHVFAFLTVCDELDLNPIAVRCGLYA